MQYKKKVFLTKENTILIVKVELGAIKENPYWSITADEVEPVTIERAKAEARESLEEDGEDWKMAVEAGNTELGLSDWVQFMLDVNGWENVIDCSLYPEQHEIDGVEYCYRSGSCGCLHEEIAKVWPAAAVFIKAHLKAKSKAAAEAYAALVADDVDAEVVKLTKKIIEQGEL